MLTQDSPLQQLGSSLLDVTTGQREDGEFEVVTSRPLLMDSLPRVERSTPLCQLDWELHFDSEGKITDLEELKEKIFRGGVEHEFRDEVWRFLLGFYRWESDTEERLTVRAQKVGGEGSSLEPRCCLVRTPCPIWLLLPYFCRRRTTSG